MLIRFKRAKRKIDSLSESELREALHQAHDIIDKVYLKTIGISATLEIEPIPSLPSSENIRRRTGDIEALIERVWVSRGEDE